MGDIIVNDIDKSYGKVEVLRNFSAVFIQGETYYIAGDSGKGKTTLLRILMGLEQIDSGEIIGLNSVKISVVFQEDRLIQSMNVLRNISFVSERLDTEIMRYLKIFGLEGFERCKVEALSGGMKRRVAILRGLLCDSHLLLLDEPFKGLDDTIKSVVIEQVKTLSKGKTVIVTTHNQEEVKQLGIENHIVL
ncbi:MAG: ATP-binding cassette domain-containing protein [Eubacteriales bacterium]